MCLAIPGRVVEILDGRRAMVDYGGTRREADLTFVEAVVGQYVLVHAGFAMQVLEESDALETLALWDEALSSFSGSDDGGDA
ncbi:MAG: HypC/HybG/HupF family hydrogenase formation chaperone [Candidatus Thermoplasmatota archaeon]|nr:HypC/HybG/HupF family hydrogenase formation chaperone [Candidatus Thermoplasmatota archaeon]